MTTQTKTPTRRRKPAAPSEVQAPAAPAAPDFKALAESAVAPLKAQVPALAAELIARTLADLWPDGEGAADPVAAALAEEEFGHFLPTVLKVAAAVTGRTDLDAAVKAAKKSVGATVRFRPGHLVVPTNSEGDHNYPVGVPCLLLPAAFVGADGGDDRALRADGTVGNHLTRRRAGLRPPTQAEAEAFLARVFATAPAAAAFALQAAFAAGRSK